MINLTIKKLEFAKAKENGVRGKLDLMSNIQTFMQLFCGWNLPGKSTLVMVQKILVQYYIIFHK